MLDEPFKINQAGVMVNGLRLTIVRSGFAPQFGRALLMIPSKGKTVV